MAYKFLAFFASTYRNRRICLCILLGLIIFTLFNSHDNYITTLHQTFRDVVEDQSRRTHVAIVEKFYRDRQDWSTSILGSVLFMNEELSYLGAQQNKTFVILVWKHWNWLQNRHIYNFGSRQHDPLEECSVKNCIFTGDDNQLKTADAVIVHLQRGDIPKLKDRNPNQRWIFLNDESPKNAFSLSGNKKSYKEFANVFNWSMTFRSDADVPVPYGRTLGLEEPVFKTQNPNVKTLIPNWKKKRRDVLATILISNCGVKFRMNFIKVLQDYMSLDVYGSCSKNETTKNRCPGHFKSGCEVISEYLFYLVLENSSCREYITEKLWYHAYSNGAIPIIMGPSKSDCERLLPPNSYLYIPVTNNATKIKELAKDMIRISKNDDLLLKLHDWRNHFKIVNEHGYFGTKSYHLCRVCQAMNYNDAAKKIYTERELQWFLDPKLLCESDIKI